MKKRSASEVLDSCDLFSGLDDVQHERLVAISEEHVFEPGELIFRQGTPCPGLFVVDAGLVRLYRLAPSGQEHVLHLCGPDQTFAEVAAIGAFAVPANAVSVTASNCVLLPADRLQAELAGSHALCRQLLTGMAFWVRHLVVLLEDVTLRDAAGRVARLLSDLPIGPEGTIELPSTKRDLASHLNLSSETFSRILRRLGERGLIELGSDRSLRLIDRGRLEDLAGR
ncbi:MAG: Crp/Fnr family transcriptional regulator [Planctomycetes bacterium]|nr:Crp/Fnr family transcriptional regulator [Phycisphaerales bacterium]MCB9834199.1 Crp/Fnr family transcriptional regulator [Planctomycetota bacterium]